MSLHHSPKIVTNGLILCLDAANKKSNQQNLGTIKSSNLCVAPETQILTDEGYFEIKSLEGKTVKVWNGEEFSETIVQKTGTDQELITIETSDGCTLDCTPYHKFYLQDGSTVEAQELKDNDTLIQCRYPMIDGTQLYPFSIEIVPINSSIKTKEEWLSHYLNTNSKNLSIQEEKLYISHTNLNYLFQITRMTKL